PQATQHPPVPIPAYIEEEEGEVVREEEEEQSDDEGWVSDDGQGGATDTGIWTRSPGWEGGSGGSGGGGSGNWDQSNVPAGYGGEGSVGSSEVDQSIKSPLLFGVGRDGGGGGSSTLHAAPRAIRSWSAGGIWRGKGGQQEGGPVGGVGMEVH
ncbi:unnamed protein product, partial [Laminaria digitata]